MIGDREYLCELAELSGYLCAQLKLLDTRHPLLNKWQSLDPRLQSTYFFNTTLPKENILVIRKEVLCACEDSRRIVSHGGTWKKIQKDGDKGLEWEILNMTPGINDLTSRGLPPLTDDLSDFIASK